MIYCTTFYLQSFQRIFGSFVAIGSLLFWKQKERTIIMGYYIRVRKWHQAWKVSWGKIRHWRPPYSIIQPDSGFHFSVVWLGQEVVDFFLFVPRLFDYIHLKFHSLKSWYKLYNFLQHYTWLIACIGAGIGQVFPNLKIPSSITI